MANVRVDLNYTIQDGSEVVFYAPCDYANVTGLSLYYPNENGGIESRTFTFKDAHDHDVTDLDHLFAEGACVKLIVSLTKSSVYIQNADTNRYLENRFDQLGGTIEITDKEPEKDNTVMVINPNPSEIKVYTVDEVDAMMNKLINEELSEINKTVSELTQVIEQLRIEVNVLKQ